MNPKSNSTVSRRTMLAASSGVVVAGVVASPAYALNDKKGSAEIETWKRQVGQVYNCNPIGGRSSTELKLVAVEPYTANDPERPKEFRAPFSLIFEKTPTRNEFQASIYAMTSRKTGKSNLFLSEAMDMGSGKMIVEAVFG